MNTTSTYSLKLFILYVTAFYVVVHDLNKRPNRIIREFLRQQSKS